jgi:hypothetical protein
MTRPSHKETLPIIQEVKDKLKKSKTYQKICDEHNLDYDFIDLVPMAFADLDVSARTDKGVIYFNFKLLDDGDFLKDDHYMAHEFQHMIDQCFGDGPTQGAAEGEYLDNKFEQEGFKTQTEYLSETRGDQEAINYTLKVMDHHDVPPKSRKQKLKELLRLN